MHKDLSCPIPIRFDPLHPLICGGYIGGYGTPQPTSATQAARPASQQRAHARLRPQREAVIDGLKCEVWYAGNMGMHPRDCFLLADALEASEEFEDFQWGSSSAR